MFKILELQEEISIEMLVVDQGYNDENDKIWRISLLEVEKRRNFNVNWHQGIFNIIGNITTRLSCTIAVTKLTK